MNCFSHDSDHWRTEPRWTLEPFCFCMNANNNTYSCIRTINSTHNFLYCEFVTGLITFYNLRIDPFETQNREKYLTPSERSFLHNQLEDLKRCKGKSCSVYSNQNAITDQMNNQRNINRQQANSFRNYHDPMSATAAIAIGN